MSKSELDYSNLKKEAVKFLDWYISAVPRSWYIYHHGMNLHKDLSLQFVKQEVWNKACEGKVYLFQKRDLENPGLFFYMAQKATKKIPRLNPKGNENGWKDH